MNRGTADQARVKLVATHEDGALFVVVFENGVIEIRDCQSEDPTAVRASVALRPLHAAALAETLIEAGTQGT